MRVFPRLISTELLAVAGLGLAAGLIVGVGITSAFYIARASSLSADLANKTVRVRVLESLITADASSFGASSLLSTEPAPSVVAAAQANKPEASAPAAPAPARPTISRAGAAASAHTSVVSPAVVESAVSPRLPVMTSSAPAPAPAPSSPSLPTTRAATPPPAPASPLAPTSPASPATSTGSSTVPSPAPRVDTPPATTQARVPPVVPSPAEGGVPPEEVAASIARNPVVGVSADRLGVARVEGAGVRMRSGSFIAVGQRFSNGERLLQVDPENNRIVTSDRQLLVFFSGPGS